MNQDHRSERPSERILTGADVEQGKCWGLTMHGRVVLRQEACQGCNHDYNCAPRRKCCLTLAEEEHREECPTHRKEPKHDWLLRLRLLRDGQEYEEVGELHLKQKTESEMRDVVQRRASCLDFLGACAYRLTLFARIEATRAVEWDYEGSEC